MSKTVCTSSISPSPGQQDQSARLAASAEVGQVEGTIHCPTCKSTDLQQFCHTAPDPVYSCGHCGTNLNADGSFCDGAISAADVEGVAMMLIRGIRAGMSFSVRSEQASMVRGLVCLLGFHGFSVVGHRISTALDERLDSLPGLEDLIA
ncbi:hypothetical protein [Comamonas thiooxydans]|uniref:hypothetical protein n=1 Tax=Comamonas thiooxydans TaxID=363952 RepID=UPI003EE94234